MSGLWSFFDDGDGGTSENQNPPSSRVQVQEHKNDSGRSGTSFDKLSSSLKTSPPPPPPQDLFRQRPNLLSPGIQPPENPATPPTPASSTFSGSTATTVCSPVVVDGVSHTPNEVKIMAELLAQARQTREFPPARYPNPDPASVVEDWNKLRALRDARGDPVLPAPEAYRNLRVEIAQGCRERDARLEEAARKQRESQLESCSLQNLSFDQARFSSILQTAIRSAHGGGADDDYDMAGVDINAVSEEIRTMVEGTLLDSSALMRSNMDRMGGQIDALQGQRDRLEAQIDSLTEAVNSRLGALDNTAAIGSRIPSISQASIQEAIRQALWDALNEMVRSGNERPVPASLGPFRRIPMLPSSSRFQELPLTPTSPTSAGIPGRSITRGDMVAAAMRSRRIRGPRPQRFKQYVGKLFTKREAEYDWV